MEGVTLILVEELHAALGRALERVQGLKSPMADPRQVELPLAAAETPAVQANACLSDAEELELPTAEELASPDFDRGVLERLVVQLGGAVRPGVMTAELKQFVRSKMATSAAKKPRKKKADAEPNQAAADAKATAPAQVAAAPAQVAAADEAPPWESAKPASDLWAELTMDKVKICLERIGQPPPTGAPETIIREALRRAVPTSEGLQVLLSELDKPPAAAPVPPAPEQAKQTSAPKSELGVAHQVLALAKSTYGAGGELYNHWMVTPGAQVPAAYPAAQAMQSYFATPPSPQAVEKAKLYFSKVGCGSALGGSHAGKCVTCPMGAGQVAICGILMDDDKVKGASEQVIAGKLLVRVRDPKFDNPQARLVDKSVGKAEIEVLVG